MMLHTIGEGWIVVATSCPHDTELKLVQCRLGAVGKDWRGWTRTGFDWCSHSMIVVDGRHDEGTLCDGYISARQLGCAMRTLESDVSLQN